MSVKLTLICGPPSQNISLTLHFSWPYILNFEKISAFFSDHHAGDAGIDANHHREDRGICYSQAPGAFDAQLSINDGQGIFNSAHLTGASWMIDSVSGAACVLRKLLIALNLASWGQLSFYPLAQCGL